ncbi:hypothetical protein TNCV_1794161 [Trichonephila clavipes]|nr:hypothetical protein TNCV_1794161 [Trichonephila clavipes]
MGLTNKGLEYSLMVFALIPHAVQSRARRVKKEVVFLGHMTFSHRDVLQHRVKMSCENASILVACNRSPYDKEILQFIGRYYTPNHHRISSMFHRWNQAVNMKCFCRYLTDKGSEIM